jgi:hypothetical protein
MNNPALAYLLVPLGVLGMLLLGWTIVPAIIAKMGWSALAAAHGTTFKPAGPRHTARHARFAGLLAGYNNVVRVAFLPQGAHFSVAFPFMAGHQPFLLPWSSLAREALEPAWFGERYVVEFDDPGGRVRLRFAAAVQPALRAALSAADGAADGAVPGAARAGGLAA